MGAEADIRNETEHGRLYLPIASVHFEALIVEAHLPAVRRMDRVEPKCQVALMSERSRVTREK